MLAAAVVQQTLDDALSERADGDREYRVQPTEACQREAIAFCILAEGSWAAARATWCKLAGLDPEKVRQHVIAELKARRQAADGPPAATMEPDMARKKPAVPAAKPLEPVAAAPAQPPPAPPPAAGIIIITSLPGAAPQMQIQGMNGFEALGVLVSMVDAVKNGGLSQQPTPASA